MLSAFFSASAVEPARLAIDVDRPISGYALTAAFPGISFNQPVGIASPPGETNRLFVIEREGLICVITNLVKPNKSVFLDLRGTTDARYIEGGLLGLAFHPNFQSNGYFFVFRTSINNQFRDRLSRFSISSDDPNRADRNEVVLIDQEDIANSHNAGDLHFGPDGYLYISVGDETPPAADRRATHQAIDGGFFGGILRIDVDQKPGSLARNPHPASIGNYSIPADNPFIGATNFLGAVVDPSRVRTEFFAVGMRNPWRFTIDQFNGQLIVGDVGFGWREEINVVKKGANYGWPYWEDTYEQIKANESLVVEWEWPLHAYGRGKGLMEGNCIVGGIVCRSQSDPALEGWYIFGDEGSGNIWKMRTDNADTVEWIAREPGIVSFGRDPATGDVLGASLGRGEIRRLVYIAPEEKRVPTQLSAAGIFTNLATMAPAPGIVPFQINVPFWSDHALKSRWFGLMDGSKKIGFSPTNNWTFPHGSVWVKHFELELEKGNRLSARRVETRLLIKSGEDLHGFTYRWNTNGTDAELVGSAGAEAPFHILDKASGTTTTQVWVFPARGDCAACHTKHGGEALGFNTPQLNVDLVRPTPENQLKQLARLGYIDANQIDPTNLPRHAKISDRTEPLEHRVKSYLSANCSQCHQPAGVWYAHWDARWSSPMSDANVLNAVAVGPVHGGEKIVEPHSLTNSMIYLRLTEPALRMPPIGSRVLDDSARELVGEWINSLPDGAFAPYEVGGGVLRGSVAQQGGSRMVSGIGLGMGVGEDRLHLLGHRIKRSGHVVARISAMSAAPPGARAGVMVRESAEADAAAVWLSVNNAGTNFLRERAETATEAGDVAVGQTNKPWLRLVRNGSFVTAWESADAINWSKVGQSSFRVSGDAIAGVSVASGADWRYATAAFDEVQTMSISLNIIETRPNAPLPHDISLQADVETNGVAVARVNFLADGQLIGSATTAPWRMTWTNAWAGSYPIIATVTDARGLSVESEPETVNLVAAPPMARFLKSSAVSARWRENFGALGRSIPAIARELPDRVELEVSDGAVRVYSGGGLLPEENSTLPATAWKSEGVLSLMYRPGNEVSHRISLFFAPYENAGPLKVSFLNAATGAKLFEQVVSDFGGGAFYSWAVRGPVELRIESAIGQTAHLSGIFLDMLSAPVVTLNPIEDTITLPSTIVLTAEAYAEGREIKRVEFWDGATKIGEDTAAPYEFQWTNAFAGEHFITAWTVGEFGIGAYSEPIRLLCALPSASATFVGEDRGTRGEWIGPYGNVGHVVVKGWTNLPPKITVAADAFTWLFGYPATVPGSLRISLDSEDLLSGCYYADADVSLEIRVATRDGRPTRLSLYFDDWLGPIRAEEIRIFNRATTELLDRREMTSFRDGAHLSWNIQGDVRVSIRSLNDYNSIVNAIFFDPPESTAGFWLRQRFPAFLPSAAKWAEDPDDDGRPNLLEYAAGSEPLIEDPPILHSATLTGGMFHVTANLGSPPSDVRILLETSTDLVNWENSGATLENGAYDVPYRLPAVDASARFFRLRAELIGN